VLREDVNPSTGAVRDWDVVPLRRGQITNALEADLRNDRRPLALVLKLKVDANGAEQRADFVFPEYSVEPAPIQ
jgi:hypothetical protein